MKQGRRKIRVTIRISRYQRDKKLGEIWREQGDFTETFTEFRKRMLKEMKNK